MNELQLQLERLERLKRLEKRQAKTARAIERVKSELKEVEASMDGYLSTMKTVTSCFCLLPVIVNGLARRATRARAVTIGRRR